MNGHHMQNPAAPSHTEPRIYAEHPDRAASRITPEERCAGTGQPRDGAFCPVCRCIQGANRDGMTRPHKKPSWLREAR